ncbi:hypothetical protein GLOIN_2v1788213 [Rhizophagus clarus]|uniref:Uncharacterized protein n=1 Tax=Rhizophagus clarus TaxID=94130 RepID=A0A8H3LIC2_9GLOM|nr:hypothetical protein GLOIN_2v1788213 [Rhizophagus clarus]
MAKIHRYSLSHMKTSVSHISRTYDDEKSRDILFEITGPTPVLTHKSDSSDDDCEDFDPKELANKYRIDVKDKDEDNSEITKIVEMMTRMMGMMGIMRMTRTMGMMRIMGCRG